MITQILFEFSGLWSKSVIFKGFTVFLLLFRYIEKIVLSDFFEVEMRAVAEDIQKTISHGLTKNQNQGIMAADRDTNYTMVQDMNNALIQAQAKMEVLIKLMKKK